ncbi:MAG: HD domain-containing protein [Chloroflexi bacterium]|nr:HD domain-containing protein [Chloroflexota bacterium]
MRDLAKYLYEIGHLKRVKRSGWWMVGINDPESVAEHSFRTAILGYILACLEGADPMKTAMMCLFHDTHEARILDLHRVAKRYLATDEGERVAFAEQTERLPQPIATEVTSLIAAYEERESLEACVAHDADRLECLMQGCEYQVQGYDTQEWIVNCQAGLKTASAKHLAQTCLETEPREWWQGLKQIDSIHHPS